MSALTAVRVQHQAILKAMPVLKSLTADKEVGGWAREELRKAPAHLNRLQQAERQAEVEEVLEMVKTRAAKTKDAAEAQAAKKSVKTAEKKEPAGYDAFMTKALPQMKPGKEYPRKELVGFIGMPVTRKAILFKRLQTDGVLRKVSKGTYALALRRKV